MRIAIFDYRITPNTPVGSEILQIIQSLYREHEFTVFAYEFENPNPECVEFVQIPKFTHIPILPYLIYHFLAPIYYWAYRLRRHRRFDLIQIVESNLSFGDVSIVPFCHRTFVKNHWSQARASGIRGYVRWLGHWLHALMEPLTFRRTRWIVVPSHGIGRDLQTVYPFTEKKIRTILNPVSTALFIRPTDFDRQSARSLLGLDDSDIALCFVALGHFERKGLPLLLDALQELGKVDLKLIVVGGQRPGLVSFYKSRARKMGLEKTVNFVGMQKDIRPFLWAVDAFVFPSSYEGFALSMLQAGAAGVPPIVTRVNGVEEFIRDGENGFIIDRTVDGICRGISRLLELSLDERVLLGTRAREDAQHYDVQNFVEAWRVFYENSEAR